jgi:hypothetical protein
MRTARLEPLQPTVGNPYLEPADECPDPAPELVQRSEHEFKKPPPAAQFFCLASRYRPLKGHDRDNARAEAKVRN